MKENENKHKVVSHDSELLSETEMLEIYGSMDLIPKVNWDGCIINKYCGKGEQCYRYKKRKKRKK